ncbi:putative late blight resistance protein homolog R1A-10 isoform X1 [Coffea eugenioides]|uniref:putative late blight resistance protein homolog R1A-10 isoform X1 n=1 Tax=Coffea eugenioides TaxID=49369 RepID=UPI000F60A9BC|nr:putative late blight resistance protein homolog R1A-10 isoform X1 [Coffea eugenioides]
MSEAAVSFVLENLKQIAVCNAHLIADVRENFEKLFDQLKILKGFVKDYTEMNSNTEALKALRRELKSVVGETEDVIDEYIVHASTQKARGKVDYGSKLRDLGKKIEQVSRRVKLTLESQIVPRLEAAQIQDVANGRAKKKQASIVEEDNVIGFDDATKAVMERLQGGSEDLEVISIVGMPGLGKTTLAKKVLHDPKIEYDFFARAFIYVSQQFERTEVFLNILGSIGQLTEEAKNMPEEKLAEHVREQLKTRMYLIVMDDVWKIEDWDKLKVAFPNNKKRSRVLITTRNTSVAIYANPAVEPYHLDFLTFDASRELLRRKVFGENKCPEEVEQHEVHMVKKCDGLPLSIVVIAGILIKHRQIVRWWGRVADSVNDYISRDEKHIRDVIILSYNHLPYHLKPCFLYLGVFREDFEIPAWKLLRLWIAEGFVPQQRDLNLEDIAEEYLEELVDRNLVMVGQRRSNGQIKTCRVHDTLRDFCKEEGKEENIFHEIKKDDREILSSKSPTLDDCRRLCINANVMDYMSKKPSDAPVRSFLTSAKEETALDAEHVSLIPRAFKLLRVLEAKSLRFAVFPPDLCQLVLLKYISMSCKLDILPPAMSTLWSLQTLIVDTTARTLQIKSDIWKMPQLRHLHTNTSTSLPCPTTPRCETLVNANLQTLSSISPQSCTKELFERTPKLKKLAICGKLAVLFQANGRSNLFESLCALDFLENLKLLNEYVSSPLKRLPQEHNFPRKLTKLTLSKTLLPWNQMSTLGKLANLEVLKLKINAFTGDRWRTESEGFQSLQFLHIGSTGLSSWDVAAADHLPVLKSLVLKHCPDLRRLPPSLGHISTLQLIDLSCTNPRVASSAKDIENLKLKQAQQKGSKSNRFMLLVYPPDHLLLPPHKPLLPVLLRQVSKVLGISSSPILFS